MVLGGIVLPDSPASLTERGKLDQARRVLSRIRGVEDVSEEFGDIVEAARQGNLVRRPWVNLFRPQYRWGRAGVPAGAESKGFRLWGSCTGCGLLGAVMVCASLWRAAVAGAPPAGVAWPAPCG